LLAAGLAVRLYGFAGQSGNDELNYAQRAMNLAEGSYQHFLYVFDGRIGFWSPLALIYRLGWRGDAATSFLPLLLSLGTLWLVVLLGRRLFGARVGWLAGALLAAMPLDARLATTFRPDAPLSFWIALAAWLLWLGTEPAGRRRGALCFGGGISLGVAWLCKEPAVFGVAALLAAVLLARRASWTTVLATGGGLALVLGLETLTYAHWAGDPLFRLHAMQNTYRISAVNFVHAAPGLSDMLHRWLVSFWAMLLTSPEFGLLFWLAIAAGVGLLLERRRRRLDPSTLFTAGWFAALLLLFVFGSTSVKEYRPLVLVPRYFLPLVAPGALLVARWLSGLAESRPARREMLWAGGALLLATAALLSLFLARERALEALGALYRLGASARRPWSSMAPRVAEQLATVGPLLLATLAAGWAALWLAQRNGWRPALATGLVLLTGLHLCLLPTRGYLDPERRIAAYLAARPDAPVVTDWLTAQRLDFFSGFRQRSRWREWPRRQPLPAAHLEYLRVSYVRWPPRAERLRPGALLVLSPRGYEWNGEYEYPFPPALKQPSPDMRRVFDAGKGAGVYVVGPGLAAAW